MKRVILFRNGSGVDGKVLLVTHSLEEVLAGASQKLGIRATHLYTPQGGLIDDLRLIRDDDILYVSEGEDFVLPLQPCPGVRPPGHVGTSLSLQSVAGPSLTCSGVSSTHDWVTLNVGGRVFTTTRATLVTKEPNSMLAKMFSCEDNHLLPSNRDAHGAYLIDRSYTYFEPLLNFLRNGTLILDPSINPQGVLEEARFFGIESAVPHLEALTCAQDETPDVEPLTRHDVVKALISTHHRDELRFQGVSLKRADLSKLDLRNINFKFADLSQCNLSGANLNGCCLERANLCGANLEGAQLLNVRLLCANLESANLRSCNFEDPAGTRSNCEGVNLRGAVLEGSMLAGVNLRVATLKNANLKNCDLRGAVLAGADLENCDLSGSDLQEANLRGANLKDAAFELMLTPLHMSQTMTCDL
ncbi:BTB/POZ domain-containing protein KCTD9 [Penaeus vannamei]|uniref:BTB/POZ domain-containing protein KCTD9 n=1 Tax=Penaeus vannamei TaxID=6689 RepID=A0A3R7PFD9_PENVA|nr:BTB/POZ domain-containing protein KCTD9-like [Penaeus vannamei]ROT64595.1 BTB/POZ domain-containing protein KCTD9 [Penaeus vannamei]